MSRIRKILVALSVIMAVNVVHVPAASAGPVEDSVCYVTTEVSKWGWHLLGEEPPVRPVCNF